MRRAFVWLSLLGLPACYTYRPLDSTAPAVGSRVSVQLTPQGSIDLSPRLGADVRHVEGKVLRVDTAGIELSVAETENFRGIEASWNGEDVTVPRGAVAGMQERKLSPVGTGLTAGAVVAGLYASIKLLGSAINGSGSTTGGSGGQ